MTPLKSIRKFCLWCCVSSANEVKLCPVSDCVLYLYRMGKGRVKLKTIRIKCVDCSGGIKSEVKNCEHTDCPLYVFKMGKNPNRVGIGNRNAKFNGKIGTHIAFNNEMTSGNTKALCLESENKTLVEMVKL